MGIPQSELAGLHVTGSTENKMRHKGRLRNSEREYPQTNRTAESKKENAEAMWNPGDQPVGFPTALSQCPLAEIAAVL